MEYSLISKLSRLVVEVDSGLRAMVASTTSWLVYFYSSDYAQMLAGLLGTITAILAMRYYLKNTALVSAEHDMVDKINGHIDKLSEEQPLTATDVEKMIKQIMNR